MKACNSCGYDKPNDCFAKNASRRDGLQDWCRDCCKRHKPINSYTSDPLRFLVTKAKNRAKNKGLEFSLEPSDLQMPVVCPVLGIVLKWTNGKICDASPTLDRIDNELGYVVGNVAVISYKANRMKSNATLEEIVRLAVWLQEQQSVGVEHEK